MGIISIIADKVLDILDAVVDEKSARMSKINGRGLEVRGIWGTKELFIYGSPVTPEILDEHNISRTMNEFHWGDDSEGSEMAAFAILLWFLEKDEALVRKDIFFRDFVMRFPKEDFEILYNFVGWNNRITPGKYRKLVSTIDQAPGNDDD
ncbi:DUF6166 domain-containing protein [Methanolobus halotolerans]|uniref:Uncharacterized protein n=1 Tax=Methanolobus halotolerans TaxID=2052935 RepID=A0A4E0QRM0_9EURY|nr:DUF6166 domain-containing protein [Methanolobus halotolerans]TGC09166.1 hypothetical protein CUN85_07300 [Methanolobus halotolerans]